MKNWERRNARESKMRLYISGFCVILRGGNHLLPEIGICEREGHAMSILAEEAMTNDPRVRGGQSHPESGPEKSAEEGLIFALCP